MNACGENLRDKALISLHDEAGSRAGETLNLRIGHIEFLDNGGAVINVNGKTGKRPIHVIKSVPDLAAWMNAHPKKRNKNAPFWYNSGTYQKCEHLTYAAARRMMLRTVKKAIKIAKEERRDTTLSSKRVFMTLFRHGEITRTSKWMPQQLSKKRHGWTPNSEMLANYEHLEQNDVGNALFEHYGLEPKTDEDEKLEIPKVCHVCKKMNPPESDRCNQCGKPLDLKAALEIDEINSKEKEELKNTMNDLKSELDNLKNFKEEMRQEFKDMINDLKPQSIKD